MLKFKLFSMPRLVALVIVIQLMGEQYAFGTETLSPITVTVSRKSLEEQINNPQQLDEDEVNVAHERSISDVLQGLPGINITKTGGYGQLNALFMRGAGGQGLTTLDDIPLLLSLPGLQNLDNLPSEAIKSLEIQRGPSSAHHSFQALGGAVRFYTLDREETGAKLSVEGGSFGILRETLQGSVSGKQGRMTVTVNRADAFDGAYFADSKTNPERDKFRFTQGIMRFSTHLNDSINWQGSMLYRKSWTGTDKLGLDKSFRVAFLDDSQSFGEAETWLAQTNMSVAITPNWDSRLQMGFTQLANTVKIGSFLNSLNSRIYLANWQNKHTLIDNLDQKLQWQFIWGGQGRHEQGESQANRFNQERTMATGFLETEAQFGDLNGQLGVRVEHFDQYGDHPLFKAAAGWRLTPELTLRASGGTGYRIPSYTEFLSPFFGNLQLKPERSGSGELSLEWIPFKNMHFTVNGYYQRYDDLISQAYDPRRGPISLNVPDASVAGVELDSQYAWSDTLDTGFSYTYNDSLDLATDRLLPFRPPHTARVWAKHKFTELPVTLWAETVVRSATWNDSANSIPIKQSVHFNASIRYAITSQFEVYLRGENLTNNRASQFYSTDMPGATVFGGFQLGL